ncbi:MAG: hypothetical protein RL115_472 [Bacteroidota bacterium]|jgi:hypothetical protein
MKKLERSEMKNLKGGKAIRGGGSLCYHGTEPCYVSEGITYTCYTHWENDEEQCCCGHDAGNDNCWGA